jgi:hypothetical protein
MTSRRILICLHNLCIEDAAGYSRNATEDKKNGLTGPFGFLQGFIVILDPLEVFGFRFFRGAEIDTTARLRPGG